MNDPNPNYVDAPMEVSVIKLDPVTGQIVHGLATSEDEAKAFFCNGDQSELREAYAKALDDDLDEPLPPKQCGLDDPDCESCQ